MNNKPEFTMSELIGAIKRSGYLLESEIASFLAKKDFFVEANQVVKDPVTGKSREIDIVAEYYDWKNKVHGQKACSKIKFIFEIKNNDFPLVLTSRQEFSPNVETWESLKEVETIPENLGKTSTESFYEQILFKEESIFTQYCSFSLKKGKQNEIIATHPEQVHAGLSKITQYCEEEAECWNDHGSDDYFRKFLFLPVFLIKEDLYELQIESDNSMFLHKVEESRLVFNYHYKDIPKMATVWVVTRAGLSEFIDKMLSFERKMESDMIEAIKISS